MESPTEEATTDPSARTFAQVVFTDVPRSYPPSTHVTCCYTSAFQPNARDWVGIFKVGWSTTKDYHTFVWVEPCLDAEGQPSVTRQAVFKDYYLPKDEIEFYQFCYVDSMGQVRGASTPFCFRSPGEQSMESNPDDDLLVITTQEQVEQSVREKAELQQEVNELKEENESLKRSLETRQQAADSSKVQKEQEEKENSQLFKEMDQIREENKNLRSALEEQLKEKEHLETHTQEKYSQAVKKINQLKEERKELRAKVEAQSEENATLNSKIREKEGELYKMKDSIQLLQVDFQSSEKEKERLSAELQRTQSLTQNMVDMKRENQELCRRLSEQETQQNCPEEELRVQCQTLTCQLQDAQAVSAAARDELRNSKRRTEHLERELLQVREKLERLNASYLEAQKKNYKQELQLQELHEAAADRNSAMEENERLMKLVSQEKEELTRENQNLISEIEELRRAYADLQAAPPAGLPADHTSSTWEGQQPETFEQDNNLYENIEDAAGLEEEPLVCRHCQERFPLITPQELEQHEHSHRICPFCAMVCDNMEQSVFEDHVYSHEV